MDKIWLNGKVIDTSTAGVSIADRGFLLADGLFETFLIRNGKPVFFDAHMARLFHSAAQLQLNIPYKPEQLRDGFSTLFSAIGFQGEGSARLTISRGEGPRGLVPPLAENAKPKVMLTVTPSQAPSSPSKETSLSYIISDVMRNEGSPVSQMKSLSYTDNILARLAAQEAGANDAIMCNNKRYVACSTIGNIFVLKGSALLTPALECGVLPGITRAEILSLALELNLQPEEVELLPATLEEGVCFMSNSLMGLKRLIPLGQDITPDAADLDLFQKLGSLYEEAIIHDIGGN